MEHHQYVIDTKALEIAKEALVRIEVHERQCAEARAEQAKRDDAIRHSIDHLGDRLEEGLRRMYDRHWLIAGTVITGLLLIVGYLVANDPPWTKPPRARSSIQAEQ